MFTIDFKNHMNDDIEIINKALIDKLPKSFDGQDEVVEAMKYAISNGGKRLRPVLVLEFCKACGGSVDDAIDFACAIEYIHTYSLIHDDLPCMDDDDLRRGNPSCHKQFNEATALLAGDALLTHAFELCADANVDAEKRCNAISLLSQNAGVCGMIGGQVLDLKYENQTPSITEIISVHKLKTGALISAACILGCIAGGASDEQISSASKFAYNLGIAFQIKDDILDVVGDENVLGKPIGSDAEMNKTTYVTLEGLEKAQNDVQTLTALAIKELEHFENIEFLEKLSNYLINRDN